jgi:WD40 repeat protein
MTRYGGDKIATKSHTLLVNVWNFSSGREEASFYGYDSYSFCFSGGGLYLACGAKVGSEVARIWDIKNQKYGIFRYNGSNNNFHTVIHLTLPEPDRLICCSIDQQPIVFNTHTRELLYTCQCPYRFEEIYTIQSDLRYDVFLVKGKDETKRNVGLLYKLSDGSLLETYENYSVLELARNTGVVISKCENINGGKLTSTDLKNLSDPILNDFQIQTEKCKLLDDNKCAVIEYGDDFSKEFNLMNVENGAYIGKINFIKKNERKSAAYLTIDPIEKEMYFRYFEFLSPQETMIYKKKNIFNVEED